MPTSQPCDLCGCTEVNLHDGFYFCAECGTQDNNFQETLVDVIEVGDGILHGQRKKVVKIVEEEREMSDTWYKWHAFNFLLKGVANELLDYGANPSFKTKLLWVWTRYLNKYMKKEDMGLSQNPDKHFTEEQNENDSDSDDDKPPEDLWVVWDANRDKMVKGFSFTLLVTLIFIALNLDRSVITLTHLIKLFRDGILSVPYRIEKIVPKEMKPNKLYAKIKRSMANFKSKHIRVIAMTLFKRLDLGNPIVPDLRLIIDNHLKELCLPNDLKPLVLSLMHYKPCNFLDVNSNDIIIYQVPAYEFHVMTYILWALKLCLGLDCDYEVKLSKAVEAINLNEDRPKSHFFNGESEPTNRLFSFCEWVTFYQFRQTVLRHYCFRYANKCSWDTDDYTALEHHMDLLYCVWDKDLKDEMAYDLLHRLRGGEVQSTVVPCSEFKPTLTPFHTYSQIIAQYLQEPEVKLRLTEDFTQYSLKYVIEDWNLVNPNSQKQNLVQGIRVNDKIVTNKFIEWDKKTPLSRNMVYVRNCENHNWMTTKPPTLDHVVRVDKLDESDDDQNEDINATQDGLDKSNIKIGHSHVKDNEKIKDGVESKSYSLSDISLSNSTISNGVQFVHETNILASNKLNTTEEAKLRKLSNSVSSNSRFPDIVSDYSFTNSSLSNSIRYMDETKVFETGKLDETERNKWRTMNSKFTNPDEIEEETEGENIFDDEFKQEIKEEEFDDCEMDHENIANVSTVSDNFQDIPCNTQSEIKRDNDTDSVCSSLDSVTFNEATFDRAKTIKEIILHTCKKHKLPMPSEYNQKVPKRKHMGFFSRKIDCIAFGNRDTGKRNITHEKERRGAWKAFVTDYHAAMQDDVLNQIAQKVNAAIQNAENTLPNEENPSLYDTVGHTSAMDFDVRSNHSDVNIIDSEQVSDLRDIRSKLSVKSDEDRLFSEESDGETHAKELLPEKNPDFDEEEYDASQLYVKAAKATEDGEMELDPQLSGIIDKKMIKDAKDPSLLNWTEERKKLAKPDTEDEIPLNVLKELKELTKKLSSQENEELDPLLIKEVENYQYWFRIYHLRGYKNRRAGIFDKQLCEELPKSFSFVLRQCALICGSPEGDLYYNMQNFEITAIEKCKIKLNKWPWKRGDLEPQF